MKPETAEKVKFGVWGLIGGAVIAIIIGFAWGGGEPPAQPKRYPTRQSWRVRRRSALHNL